MGEGDGKGMVLHIRTADVNYPALKRRACTTGIEESWAAMGRLGGSPTLFATAGHLRFLGALMAFAGGILCVVAYALGHLG